MQLWEILCQKVVAPRLEKRMINEEKVLYAEIFFYIQKHGKSGILEALTQLHLHLWVEGGLGLSRR